MQPNQVWGYKETSTHKEQVIQVKKTQLLLGVGELAFW